MKFSSYLKVELRRLLLDPGTWLVCLLSICIPLAGYSFYQPAFDGTRSSMWVANPALAGALGGAILFGFFTIYQFNRIDKYNTSSLTDVIVSPLIMNAVRLMALVIVAFLTGILVSLIYLPFTIVKMSYLFSLPTYIASYGIILIPSLIMGVLFGAIFYNIVQRFDLSAILFLVCGFLPFGGSVQPNFILRWINPNVPVFSDAFSNALILRVTSYNRIFWLLLLTGLYMFSLLCVRRYEKGIFKSFIINSKKFIIPIIAMILILIPVYLYINQPFVNHAPMEYGNHSNFQGNITVKSIHTKAKPNTVLGTQQGTAIYQLLNESARTLECFIEIDCGYTVKSMTANGVPINFTDLNNDLYTSKVVRFVLPSEQDIELVVEYGGYPQMWRASASILSGDEISSQFIMLTGSSFTPLFLGNWHYDMKNTAEIILPSYMTPLVMEGSAELLTDNHDDTKTWYLERNNHSMIYMYAADYLKLRVVAKDMTADFYYSRKSEPVMVKYGIEDTLKEVMDFCTEKYGLLRSSEDDHITLLQLSATMFGGYAGGGMSVFGETTFAEDTLNDPLRGASGQEVMAHEIVHQWWGLSVGFEGEYDPDGDPEWTSEGFTVYTTYRMMKEKYGEEYANTHYVDVWKSEFKNMKNNFYHRNPQYMDLLPEQYVSRIRENERRVKKYCVMPLKILKAAELVGGEEKMDEIMSQLYKTKSISHNPTLTYQDFLSACGLTKEALELE
ncbi:hypothetical protein [Clostridium sp. Cult3]|uniref:hypothetical protein n=1 Tax=Clostridium sp. Cult3 TaxID=2079004 RepID=UPI001F21CC0E|nr:hypothetical protein [Clostridium sp. Cult3]MCF6461222.1 hypothetical protein [Clostridium sp. Cult3]